MTRERLILLAFGLFVGFGAGFLVAAAHVPVPKCEGTVGGMP